MVSKPQQITKYDIATISLVKNPWPILYMKIARLLEGERREGSSHYIGDIVPNWSNRIAIFVKHLNFTIETDSLLTNGVQSTISWKKNKAGYGHKNF